MNIPVEKMNVDDMMDINEQLWMAITVVQSKRVMFLFFCLERFLLPPASTNDRNDDERNMTTQSIDQSISFFCRRLNRLNRRLNRLIFWRRLLLIKAAHQRVATRILYPTTSSLSLSRAVYFALVATRPSSDESSSDESSFIKFCSFW
tara:strand:+ start:3453 stop:3896 length:444 start_codon:yes stop_codon:yes gene_type:complete